MTFYKPRHLRFKELLSLPDWKVKVYTISKTEQFHHPEYYAAAKEALPRWLSMKNSFNAEHKGMAFLILHAGSEGYFSLINWWLDGYMLNTNIFFCTRESPADFKRVSGDGLAPCIWEMEIIDYERRAWTEHVLKKHFAPELHLYLDQQYNGSI